MIGFQGGILKHPSIGKDNDRAWVSFLIELEKTSIYIKIGLNAGAEPGKKGAETSRYSWLKNPEKKTRAIRRVRSIARNHLSIVT